MDTATFRIRRAFDESDFFQRHRVGRAQMPQGMDDYYRMLRRNAIQFFPQRMPPLGKHRIVISMAEDGDAARNFLLLDTAAHAGDDIVNALYIADWRRVERGIPPQH